MKESKKLLIDKMFNNYTASPDSPKIAKVSKNISPVVSPIDEKSTRVVAIRRKESCADNESDAGTFVIERDQEEMKARLKIDKVFGISEAYASWSSSEESLDDQNQCKTDAVIKPRSRPVKQSSATAVTIKSSAPRLTVPLTPRKKSSSSEVGTSTSQDLTSFRKATSAAVAAVFDIESSDECSSKKGLIKELAKINKSSTQKQPAAPIMNKATTPRASKKFVTTSSGFIHFDKKNYVWVLLGNRPPPPPPVKPSGRSTSFGRNEAGRYSLRAWPSPTNSSTSVNLSGSSSTVPQRQKFTTASSSTSASTARKVASANAPQKSTELNLWLRRKEYNPIKAAAMGRTQKSSSSKIEEPPYLSDRSQSFHTGAVALSKLSIKRHQSIENKINDISGDQGSENLEIDSDSITCKYTIKFSNDPPPSTPTRSRTADKHSTNSMQNISKLTAELGTHAEQLLNKLNMDQEESNNSNRSVLLSSNSSTATLGQQSSQLEDLVRRLELANRAFEVVDQYLKDQSEKGTNSAEPSDPVSSSPKNEVHVDKDGKNDFGVRRISKTKL
uniref:Uncharacterized protein n=1 Tax=Romanomermis culicivorax TaxID=13658 RepID=A0A915LAQ3_ROMCU